MQTLTILICLVLEELWFLLLQDQPLRYLQMFPHPTPLTELPRFLQEQAHPDSQVQTAMIRSSKMVNLLDREEQIMQQEKGLQSRDKQDSTHKDKADRQMRYKENQAKMSKESQPAMKDKEGQTKSNQPMQYREDPVRE